MSSFPPLASSPLNLIALRDMEKQGIQQQVSHIEGDKCVILDTQISKPLNIITDGGKLLKDCGVKTFLFLSPSISTISEPTILFFIRPNPSTIDIVAKNIQLLAEQESTATIYIFFFPCITRLIREYMGHFDVFSNVTILNTDITTYTLDDDILSLEIPKAYSDLYLESDMSLLQHLTKSICTLEELYGVIPNVTAIGSNSQAVVDMMLQARAEGKLKEVDLPPEIDRLILIDRSVDMITPFITPLTYEGIIDELIGFDCGSITLSESKLGKNSEKLVTFRLHNGDSLFQEIRDNNIAFLGKILKEKVSQIKQDSETRPLDGNSSFSEILEFKNKIPDIVLKKRLLEIHLSLLTYLNETTSSENFHIIWEKEHDILSGNGNPMEIVELADMGISFNTIMKLLIEYSIVNNGIKPKLLNDIKNSLIEVFGFQKSLVFHNLEKLNLLIGKENAAQFSTLRSRLRLVCDGVDGNDMSDMNYTTSGYAPLTGRLVQAILQQGSLGQEIQKLLSVTVKETKQIIQCIPQEGGLKKKLALVVVVGGITYLEVAALRQIKRLENCGYEVVILTTNLTNGNRLLGELTESLPQIPVSSNE